MIAALLLPTWAVHALGLPREASQTARDMDALHAALFATTLVGTFFVGLFTAYFVFRYRRKGDAEPGPTPRVIASSLREWATGAAVLAMFLVFWAFGYRQYIRIETPPAHAMVVYVTAKQWMWKFSYDDGQTSNDTLYVPAHTRVRLVLTSRDVIHSFFAPSFRIKQDTIPGRWVNIWLDAADPGVYPIYCAEYCGVSHSQMLGRIHVLRADEWAKWRRGANPTQMIARGKQVAMKNGCLACHTLDGQRHIGPTWSRLFGSKVRLQSGRTVIADEAYLTRSMMDPLADIVAGYNPVMPSYRGHLTAEQAGALVELIRSLQDGRAPAVQRPKLAAGARDAGTEEP